MRLVSLLLFWHALFTLYVIKTDSLIVICDKAHQKLSIDLCYSTSITTSDILVNQSINIYIILPLMVNAPILVPAQYSL